jgi:TPR repeat protein
VEDQQQAVVWYRKAALQGNQSAQDELKQLGVVW